MARTRTSTRTKTTVYVIGEQLAATGGKLQEVRDLMRQVQELNEQNIHRAGVRFTETDDREQLGTIGRQWKEVVPRVVFGEESGDKLSEINRLLREFLPEEPREFKIR